MRNKASVQFIAPLLILLLIGMAFILSSGFASPDSGALNPAFYPRIIITLILIMTVLWTGLEAIKHKRSAAAETEKADNAGRGDNVQKKVLGITFQFISIAILFALGLQYLSFLIATPIFLIVSMLVLGYRNIRNMILSTSIITLVIYFGFTYLLNVRFPSGIFF